jgi:hypothetical protein
LIAASWQQRRAMLYGLAFITAAKHLSVATCRRLIARGSPRREAHARRIAVRPAGG